MTPNSSESGNAVISEVEVVYMSLCYWGIKEMLEMLWRRTEIGIGCAEGRDPPEEVDLEDVKMTYKAFSVP